MGNVNENEEANMNIVHVEKIENIMIEASECLELIQPKSGRAQVAKEQAQKKLNEYQTGALHNLRILCEGD